MAVGAHALHSVYLHNTSFLRAGRLLMHDLDESSAGDAGRCWRTDPDVAQESLNVRPESPWEVAGQEASDVLPLEYKRSTATLSGVEFGDNIPPRYLVPPYLPSGLWSHAQNTV